MKLAVSVIALVLSSCGDNGSSNNNSTGNSVDLTGTYASDCLLGVKLIRKFVGDVQTLSINYYSDNACGELIMQDTTSATFKIGDAMPGMTNTYKIDFTQTSLCRTPKTAAVVAEANSKSGFGYNDWTIDVPKDIAGRSSSNGAKQTENGATIYSIFKIDGEKYYIGDKTTGDGTSVDKRPSVIDMRSYSTKQ